MFREAARSEAELSTMAEPFRRWLARRLADGRYFGFIAEDAGQAIGGVGLMAIEWPPHPSHPAEDRRGYVLNLFVEVAHRRRGVARALMDTADREFSKRGLTFLLLHATEAGRPLCQQAGWMRTYEMAKTVKPT